MAVPVATQKVGEASPTMMVAEEPSGRNSKKMAAPVVPQEVG